MNLSPLADGLIPKGLHGGHYETMRRSFRASLVAVVLPGEVVRHRAVSEEFPHICCVLSPVLGWFS